MYCKNIFTFFLHFCIKPETSVEIVGGDHSGEGRVEIIINGERGTVCDDGWISKSAEVICHMLGYR